LFPKGSPVATNFSEVELRRVEKRARSNGINAAIK
jgi:hypothetical protein